MRDINGGEAAKAILISISAGAALSCGYASASPTLLTSCALEMAAGQVALLQQEITAAQNKAAPVVQPGKSLEIVVKFKDDVKVKDIIEAFWTNAPAARAKFESLRKGRTELTDTALDRVTYSNELVLVRRCASGCSDGLAEMRVIAQRIAASSDVSYAEVNFTAQVGAQ